MGTVTRVRVKTNGLYRRSRKKRMMKRILFAVLFVSLIAGGVVFWIYEHSRVYKVCHVETGVPLEVADFLKIADADAKFTAASDVIDNKVPGEYHLMIKTGVFEHPCTLYIEDTIAPLLEIAPVRLEKGQTCEVEDFVTKVEDITATKVAFVTEPDFTKLEKQKVEIAVTDAGGNCTVAETELIISPVVPSLTWEAGSGQPTVRDFVYEETDAKLVTDLNTIDFSKLGTHAIVVEWNATHYTVELKVVDTVAPVFEMRDITAYAFVPRTVEEFVTSSSDVTELVFMYNPEPDFTKVGTQDVTILAVDIAGNQTMQTAKLTLIEDTEAPTITGATDLTVYKGRSVSYKSHVKAKDNCPDGLSFTVDSSQVNLQEVGTYPVTYIARDLAGNETKVTVNVVVMEQTYSIDEVHMYADQVLSSIITEGMSQYEKAFAIFTYTKHKIGYINSSAKNDYVRAAYEGLVYHRGDCYVYASTAKVLLDRAGIVNMDIERIPAGNEMHYWNLVDIGDGHGWYHFDTTPRQVKAEMFLWTDAQLMEYSNANYNCYNYDRTRYPNIP